MSDDSNCKPCDVQNFDHQVDTISASQCYIDYPPTDAVYIVSIAAATIAFVALMVYAVVLFVRAVKNSQQSSA
jgi:hypothetical protein